MTRLGGVAPAAPPAVVVQDRVIKLLQESALYDEAYTLRLGEDGLSIFYGLFGIVETDVVEWSQDDIEDVSSEYPDASSAFTVLMVAAFGFGTAFAAVLSRSADGNGYWYRVGCTVNGVRYSHDARATE